MAILDLRPCNRDHFVGRVEAVRYVDQRRWGLLTPAGLLRHLRLGVEASLGEVPDIEDRSKPVVRVLMRWAIFHVFTRWPQGKIKVPDHFTPDPEGGVDEERAELVAAIDRFLHECEEHPERRTVHEMLGPLTLRYWRHVHGVHFAHHFRQYGVE